MTPLLLNKLGQISKIHEFQDQEIVLFEVISIEERYDVIMMHDLHHGDF